VENKMLTTSTWTITGTKAHDAVDGRQKQIYAISYTITGEKNGVTDSMSDTCLVSYNPDESYLAYEDLTEDILREWVLRIMNKAAEERILEAKIDSKASQTIEGLPWNK
jgi:hypothetical protein